MNRSRRLLISWEKKEENYLALLHFACAWITYVPAGGNHRIGFHTVRTTDPSNLIL